HAIQHEQPSAPKKPLRSDTGACDPHAFAWLCPCRPQLVLQPHAATLWQRRPDADDSEFLPAPSGSPQAAYPPNSLVGAQSGMAGGSGLSSCSANSPSPYTTRPPTTVRCDVRKEISSSETLKKSLLGTIKSASCPTAMRPRLPSSLENQATFSVHMRNAVSRSSRLRCGYICVPPTVLPVIIHDSDTQGL